MSQDDDAAEWAQMGLDIDKMVSIYHQYRGSVNGNDNGKRLEPPKKSLHRPYNLAQDPHRQISPPPPPPPQVSSSYPRDQNHSNNNNNFNNHSSSGVQKHHAPTPPPPHVSNENQPPPSRAISDSTIPHTPVQTGPGPLNRNPSHHQHQHQHQLQNQSQLQAQNYNTPKPPRPSSYQRGDSNPSAPNNHLPDHTAKIQEISEKLKKLKEKRVNYILSLILPSLTFHLS